MDSLDLFKKLTSNLFFNKTNKETGPILQINTTDSKPQTKTKESTSKIKLKNIKLSNDENANQMRNVHHINIVGADCPCPIENLNELFFTGFDEKSILKASELDKELNKLIENFNSYNFKQLTPIQMQGIKTFII